jgi:regulator of sigma D
MRLFVLFKQVNGFSNNYMGWGSEEEDLRARAELAFGQVILLDYFTARYYSVYHKVLKKEMHNKKRLLFYTTII